MSDLIKEKLYTLVRWDRQSVEKKIRLFNMVKMNMKCFK